jgi:hypothetical protein
MPGCPLWCVTAVLVQCGCNEMRIQCEVSCVNISRYSFVAELKVDILVVNS